MVVRKPAVLLVVVYLSIAGCAATAVPEPPRAKAAVAGEVLIESRTDNQLRRDAWADRFRKDRARCLNAGKRIVVMASGAPDRNGIPVRGDRYFCQ